MTKLTALIGTAMVTALKRRGLRRRELAQLLGVSPPYVTALLSGGENVTLNQVARVLDALRFRLDVRLVRARRPTQPSRRKRP